MILNLFIFFILSFPYFSRKENIRCYSCHLTPEILTQEGKDYMHNYENPDKRKLLVLSPDLDMERSFPISVQLYFDNNKNFFSDIFIAGQASANRKLYLKIRGTEKIYIKEFFFTYRRFGANFFAGMTNFLFHSPLKFVFKDSIFSFFYVPENLFPHKEFSWGIFKNFHFKDFITRVSFNYPFPKKDEKFPEYSFYSLSFYSKVFSTDLFFLYFNENNYTYGLISEIIFKPLFMRGIFIVKSLENYFNVETGIIKMFKNPFSLFLFFDSEYKNQKFYPGFSIYLFVQENIRFGAEYKILNNELISDLNLLKLFIDVHL